MDTVEAVRRWVRAHDNAVVDELIGWVSQPSVSRTGEGMADAAQFGAELLRRSGLQAEIAETAGWPALIGRTPGPAGTPHVLIYGHYDVQPVGPLADWTSPPFTPEMRAGRLYGRGTGDNKGQHLAHLLALRALRAVTGNLPCRVTVLLDGEEETGSAHLADVVRDCLHEAPPDLVVWSDGPVHESGRPTLALGVRGIVIFELRARGATSALHSGNWGGIAPNPAWELVQLLASMRAPDGTILVDGFADGVPPLSAGEQAALRRLPVDPASVLASIGARAMEPPESLGYHERFTAPTLTINSLSCEDAGDHRTVIPSVAVARCDVRLVGGQRVADVTEALRRHVAAHAPHVEFVVRGSMEPSRTLPESAYTGAILTAMAETLGEEPLIVPTLGGSLPIAALGDGLDRPCYGVPLANVDEANHAPNENFELDRFRRGIVTAAAIQCEIAKVVLPKPTAAGEGR